MVDLFSPISILTAKSIGLDYLLLQVFQWVPGGKVIEYKYSSLMLLL